MGTLERTQKVVAECLGQDVADVQPQSRLVKDLGAESLDLLELVFLLEQEFRIHLASEEIVPNARVTSREVIDQLTVADIAAVLDQKLADAKPCEQSGS